MKIKHLFIDFFFPQKCINCGRYGNNLCDDCLSLIEIFQTLNCPFCNKAVPRSGKVCKSCSLFFKIDQIITASPYQNPILQKAIKAFKYQPYLKNLATPLASLIISHLFITNNKIKFSEYIFIPVPISPFKLRSRGYNQAQLLAEVLAQHFNARIVPDLLIKTKNTPSQTQLSKEERKINIKGSFSVKEKYKKQIQDKKFVIVDDVCTTGATLNEIAKILKEYGAKEVIGMVVAKE